MHISFAALAAGLTLSFASASMAQSLRDVSGPAETPPSSFSGTQYVDSQGCIFIRAGVDGATTWVPRVDRQRNVVCGATPTFADAKPVPTPDGVVLPPSPDIAVLAPPPPPVRSVTYQPSPEPEYLYPPYSPPPTYAGPPPGTSISPCPNLSVLGQRYVANDRGPVRCGPQAESPYYEGYAGAYQPGYGIVISKPPVIAPPPGYRAAFDDGRFNTYRGPVTEEGNIQMRLVWTDGVPRRLVRRNTERYVVVNGVPTAEREYILTNGGYGFFPRGGGTYYGYGVPGPGDGYVISSKGVEPPSTVPAVKPEFSSVKEGHRFVQVGLFTTDAKARASAARIKALGLPVHLGRATHKGKPYLIVLAGPFNSSIALQTGLNAVQGAGYAGARTR
ncbi:MAG: SPOR domain-containing protein [Pseudomonadota bacterium]